MRKITRPPEWMQYYGFAKWWQETIEPINKMFEEGFEVYYDSDQDDHYFWHEHKYPSSEKKAFIINVQSIKQETLEEVVKDWLKFEENEIRKNGPYISDTLPKLMDRAKRVLGESDKDE